MKTRTGLRFSARLCMFAVLALVLFGQSAFCGTYGGGAGSAEEPFLISTAEDMQEIGANEGDWGKHFVLMADIDLSVYTGTSFNIIGNELYNFTGRFDGNGHIVSNFSYASSSEDFIGLFGYVGTDGHIRDIGLIAVNLDVGTGDYAGGLVGKNLGIISGCFVEGNVRGIAKVGGLARAENIGGLAGANGGIIINCYSTGKVLGVEFVGGFTGANGGVITNCYATGIVRGKTSVGSFSGRDYYGIYDNCFWNIEINSGVPGIGTDDAPVGVMGLTTSEMQTVGTFANYGWDIVGESINGTEDIWYIPGCVSPVFSWQSVGTVPDVAGLPISEATNFLTSAGLVVTTKIVHNEVVEEGFVISQDPASGCEAAIVTIFVSNGFPYEAGSGTAEDPFEIWTAEQMNAIGVYPEDWDKEKVFVLMSDIDLSAYSGTSFNIIGNTINTFMGRFESNGHTISNFTYASTNESHIGLFGCVGWDGEVSNLGLTNISIDAGEGEKYTFIGNIIGGLVGYNEGNITNCQTSGSVNGVDGVGGLAGENNGTITNCYALGSVTGNDAVGGIAGGNHYEGLITNSYATANVDGNNNVGGLTGNNVNAGLITHCYATGRVNGNDHVGGLVGANWFGGTITNCYASGNVIGTNSVGGLAGLIHEGFITGCYSTGNVSGADSGGIAGVNRDGSITRCYALGRVQGGNCGGVVGYNSGGTITFCYAGGIVSGSVTVGGFIGHSNGDGNDNYQANFWNNEINPDLFGHGEWDGESSVVKGITTLQMQTLSTYISHGWDFVGESTNGTEDVWYMPECGEPVLSWQGVGIVPEVRGLTEAEARTAIGSNGPSVSIETVHSDIVPSGIIVSQEPEAGCEVAFVTLFISDGFPYEGGSGTVYDPYQIMTAEQMQAIGASPGDWDKHYVLIADVDMSAYTGTSYNIIGDVFTYFTGVFDGHGQVISNLTIDTEGSKHNLVGLFGIVGSSEAEVRNLCMENVNITGSNSNHVGGLVGYNRFSTINNCRVTGSVNGYWYVGGLAGTSSGTLSNCYAAGSVSGVFRVGGLLGSGGGTIANCHSECGVSGGESVGGLAGASGGEITNCYSVGVVSGDTQIGGLIGSDYDCSYDGSFWNSDVNDGITGLGNVDDPDGVVGLGSGEMQMQSTFVDAGWDFVGEDVNGSDDVWRMCLDGVGYPALSWEFDMVGDFVCPDGVGGEDVSFMASEWLNNGGRGDLNGDGVVDMVDYALFAEFWVEED